MMTIDFEQAALSVNQAIQILKIAENHLNDVRLALVRAENCINPHEYQQLIRTDKLKVEELSKECGYTAAGLTAFLSELAPSSEDSSA
jgi:hypothetical protein